MRAYMRLPVEVRSQWYCVKEAVGRQFCPGCNGHGRHRQVFSASNGEYEFWREVFTLLVLGARGETPGSQTHDGLTPERPTA
jgi:hypothetical protein